MKLDLLVSAVGGVDPVGTARHAESLGYDRVWVGELWHESAVVQLAEMAAGTDEIGLGSAIVNVYSRTPAVLAMTAASLQRAADGRFTLGTGVSTPVAIEGLHGMAFDRPVRRAHETIGLVRELTSNADEIAYDGELLESHSFPGLDVDVPIYHAGLGPANRRVVGRLCDGWLPHNIPFSELETARETIVDAADENGRDPEEITVAPYVPTAVDDDPDRARAAIRRHVAYYVGSGEGYRRAVATAYPDAASAIADAWRAGDREGAADAVTAELVEDLGVAGRPETVRTRVRSLVDDTPIDRPIVVVPAPAAAELGAGTIDALAPERF